MFRKIFWINLGLLIIILLLSYNLYNLWSRFFKEIISPSFETSFSDKLKKISMEETDEDVIDYKPASQMSYSSIIEKDLFRPEREEWQPPPPPEEEEVDLPLTTPYPQYPGQQQPLEMEKPTVHGIIIIGESKKYAIMQGWKREEAKERTRKIRLGDGQIREVPLPSIPGKLVQDNIRAYQIGDSIAEAHLVDILPDKVILEKEDGERYEVVLREKVKLEKWKPLDMEMQSPQMRGQSSASDKGSELDQPPQFPTPPREVQPYAIPPGVPIYPPYIPVYPPVAPPGNLPPQRFVPPPQPEGFPPVSRRQPYRQFQRPGQPDLSIPPAAYPPGRFPYPPGRFFPRAN